jgi:Hemerythrin HHE cation binding domain
MSGVAMIFAAAGFLPPVAGALTQEVIDIAVILNALRALGSGHKFNRQKMPTTAATALHLDHERMEPTLDRLQEIADALDYAENANALALILEANDIIARRIVKHERDDESAVYPRVAKYLADHHGLAAMSRAHREIIHLARLLRRLADGLTSQDTDRYLIRDAQRVIESIEALVRIHNAQEEDIYEHAMGA